MTMRQRNPISRSRPLAFLREPPLPTRVIQFLVIVTILIASRAGWSIPLDLTDCSDAFLGGCGPQVSQGRLHICVAGILHHRTRIDSVPQPGRDAGSTKFVQFEFAASEVGFHPVQAVPAPAAFNARTARGPLGHHGRFPVRISLHCRHNQTLIPVPFLPCLESIQQIERNRNFSLPVVLYRGSAAFFRL